MSAIRLSASGVAEFFSATPAHRRRILKPYKFKKSGESKGRAHYYKHALHAIKAYFKAGGDAGIIADAIHVAELKKKGPLKKGELASLNHNIRALKAFLEHHGHRKFHVIVGRQLETKVGTVEVTCMPDLWAEEDGKLTLIKFYFSQKPPLSLQVPVLLHLLREGAIAAGLEPAVVCLDVSGSNHKCPADRQKMNAFVLSIEAEITKVWNSL
jgi:hypothetical protein